MLLRDLMSFRFIVRYYSPRMLLASSMQGLQRRVEDAVRASGDELIASFRCSKGPRYGANGAEVLAISETYLWRGNRRLFRGLSLQKWPREGCEARKNGNRVRVTTPDFAPSFVMENEQKRDGFCSALG